MRFSRIVLFPFDVQRQEILLLGTGKHVAPLPRALRNHLNQEGIQVDIMDTVRVSRNKWVFIDYNYSGTLVLRTICWLKRVDASLLHYYRETKVPGMSGLRLTFWEQYSLSATDFARRSFGGLSLPLVR